MSDRETLKAELRKVSAKAIQAKMDLHDLSEELPINWTSIMLVAQKAYDAYAELERKGLDLKALEKLKGATHVVSNTRRTRLDATIPDLDRCQEVHRLWSLFQSLRP